MSWTKVGYSEKCLGGNQGVGQEGCVIDHLKLSEHSGCLHGINKRFKITTGKFHLRQRHATDMVPVKFNFVLFVFITRLTLTYL